MRNNTNGPCPNYHDSRTGETINGVSGAAKKCEDWATAGNDFIMVDNVADLLRDAKLLRMSGAQIRSNIYLSLFFRLLLSLSFFCM
jgi:hypothetical protein